MADVGVRRLVYREIRTHDTRSAQARSNKAKTGGGARDLRYAHAQVGVVLMDLLPGRRTELRKREGILQDETVAYGPVHWTEVDPDTGHQVHKSQELVYEPPTDSRGNMGRLTVTYKLPPLAKAPEAGHGTAFALFYQDDQDQVWVTYAYEDDLRAAGPDNPDGWLPQLAQAIVGCLDNPQRRQDRVVQGYADLRSGQGYCHVGTADE